MTNKSSDIIGAKAGATPSKPYIQQDTVGSTQTVEIVYGIGDGENEGLINGLNSIILDGTRVIGSSGEVNYTQVKFEERKGLIDQAALKLIEDTSVERTLNLEVRDEAPVVSSFNNNDVDKYVVRVSIPQLMQNKDNGDSIATAVTYAIEAAVDGGAYSEILRNTVYEKITNGFEIDHEFDAPAGSLRTLRVRRITASSSSQLLVNKIFVAGITEVINAKFSHPTLHHIGLVFNAEQFNNIPKVVFHYKGRKIKVPTNYNPVTRKYTGIWDGTFKVVYSNNPAWVLYDILTDRRSGLGRRLTADLIDKWELYQIGIYCDELVPDGKGAQEPRFVCNNLILNSKQDAYQVIRDIASIFRGQSFWNGTQIITRADAPRDIDYAISMANVISYSYSGTASDARHNVVKAQYYDRDNENKAAYEYATDYASIRETESINELEVRAFGCDSAGQAQRLARYVLLSEQTETRILAAKVSLEGFVNMQLGDIFAWSDRFLAGADNGGRVVSVAGKVLTLDRAVTSSAKVGDTIFVNTASGKANTRKITAVAGNKVTLDTALATTEPEFVWVIDSVDLSLLYFKLDDYKVNTTDNTVDIVGIQHVAAKYGKIDTETALEAPLFSKVEIETLRAPENVTINFNVKVEQGLNVADIYAAWQQVKGATRYTVEFRRENQAWRTLGTVTGVTHTIENVTAGIYEVRVRASDSIGNASPFGYSPALSVSGAVLPPPALASIRATGKLFAIQVDWTYPAGAEASLAAVVEYTNQDPTTIGAVKQKLNVTYPQTSFTFNGLSAHAKLWVRGAILDKYNQEGAYTSWVSATADSQPDEILEIISGHITAGTLDQVLTDKIQVGVDAKAVADIAKTAAATAQTRANLGVANAATAQTQANLGVTNAAAAQAKANAAATAAATAQTQANLGVSNAATAQTQANLGVANAAIAKTAADNAQAQANVGVTNAAAAKVVADKAAADLLTKTNAINADIAGVVSTMNNGFTSVRTDFAAADTVVTGKIDAYKVSNDAALATVATKAESAVTANTATANNVTALTTRVTTAEGKIATKAENSALTALDSKVTTVDGKVTSQGTAITALTGRVTTAEGTLSTKADSSALTALDSKVTQQGGTVSSQGTAITKLQNDLATTNTTVSTKASSAALQTLDNRVVSIDGKVTTNASSITALNGKMTTVENGLATKADSSALNNYYTKTAADTATAGKIESFNAALKVGSVNLLAQTKWRTPAFSTVNTANGYEFSLVKSVSPFTVWAQYGVWPLTEIAEGSPVVFSFKVKALDSTPLSIGGHTTGISSSANKVFLDGTLVVGTTFSGGTPIVIPNDGNFHKVTVFLTKSAVTNDSMYIQPNRATSYAQPVNCAIREVMLSIGNVDVDWIPPAEYTQGQLSANSAAISTTNTEVSRVNGVVVAQGTQLTNLTATVAGKADASALASLTTRVTTEEGKSTSQGTAITSLQNSVTGLTGVVDTKATSAAVTVLDNKVVAIDGRVTTNASAITTLNGKMTTVENGLATKLDASVISDYYTKTQADTATAGKIDEFKSAIEDVLISTGFSGSSPEYTTDNSFGEIVKVNSEEGVGGKLLRLGDNVGNDVVWIHGKTFIAYDASTLYKVRARFKRVTGTGIIYVGIAAKNADKSKYVTTTGTFTTSMGSSNYLVSYAPPLGVWQTLEFFVTGQSLAAASGNGSITTPRNMQVNAKHITPMFIANYGATGEVLLDYVTIEVANEHVNIAANSTAISTTNTEVSRVNGVVVSQGTAITKLTGDLAATNGTVATKADSSALTVVDNKLTTVDGKTTTNASAITTLNGKMSTVEGTLLTKADGSALTALTTRVTNAEGVNSTQSTNITTLTNNLATTNTNLSTKADTSAVTALDSKVTGIDGRVTANTSNITSLSGRVTTTENGLATKADTSAVTALTTRVGTVEGGLSSASSNITKLESSLNAVNSGASLIPDYAMADVNSWRSHYGYNLGSYFQTTSTGKITNTVFVKPADVVACWNYSKTLLPNDRTYKLSMWVRRPVGATGTIYFTAGVHGINGSFASYTQVGKPVIADDTWQYVEQVWNLTTVADTKQLAFGFALNHPIAGFKCEMQGFKVEAVITNADTDNTIASSAALTATNSEVTRINGVVVSQGSSITTLQGNISTINGTLASKADGSALTALTTRVTNAEGVNTTQSGQITTLTNNLATTDGKVANKAESSAVSLLDSKVTAIDGRVSTNSSLITSLAGRVTTTENNISTKADASALNNYYTIVQADTAIAGKIDEFNASLVLGGVNILRDSDNLNVGAATATLVREQLPNKSVKLTGSGSTWHSWSSSILMNSPHGLVIGDDITVTLWLRAVDKANVPSTVMPHLYLAGIDAVYRNDFKVVGDLSKGGLVRYVQKRKVTSGNATVGIPHMHWLSGSLAGGLIFEKWQIEKGTTPSEWSPANLDTQSQLDANATAINTTNTEVSRVNGVVVSQGTQLTNLNATLTTLSGTVNTKADGSALTSLTTRVTNAEGVNSTQSGQLTTLTGNITTINGSLATKAENSALTALDSKVTAIDGRVTSQNSSITTLNSSLATTNTNVTAAQNAANAANTLAGGKGKVLYQTATPTGADQDAKNLWIDITANANTPKRWNGTAWVAVSDKAATDALAAANAANTALTNKADASAVTALTTRVSNAEGVNTSQATQLTNLSSTVGSHTTSISSQSTTIDGIKAVHAFKIDNNGVISGYGLVSEIINGVVKSQFGINADSFYIGSPTTGKKPFVVIGAGGGVINGVTVPAGTYIDTLMVADGTITRAHIKDLAVDSAKIADAAITTAKIGDAQITTAKVGDLQVGTAKIANAAITTAKIGDLQVDTLKIKDDAVTVSVAAQNVSSLSIVTTGGKVRVNLGLSYYYAVNGGDASNRLVIRVYRNNALIRTYSLRPTAVAITSVGSEGGGATIASAFFSFTQELPMIVDAVPAGSYTYSVTLADPRYNGMYESAYLMESIALMEVKK